MLNSRRRKRCFGRNGTGCVGNITSVHIPDIEEEPELVTCNKEREATSRFPLIFKRREGSNSGARSFRSKVLRIMGKNGKFNVFYRHIPNKSRRFAKDLENTLINTRWRWILLCLCIANAVAWVVFAFMWMAVAAIHGDMGEYSVSEDGVDNGCIVGTRHFTGYLLLSIETLTSIGFGTIYPTCTESWIPLTLQALTGVAIEGVLVTAVYVKMSRPLGKYSMKIFSKRAVVSFRDGKLSLIFRIRDVEGKHWAKTRLQAYFVHQRRISGEGEELTNYLEKLTLNKYGFLMWPVEIVHEITETSPLWDVSAKDLLTERFEILVILEGDSISTGHYCQSQTSYLSTEISWGGRFVPCLEFCDRRQQFKVDCDRFNAIAPIDTPLCSASRLSEVRTGVKNSMLRPTPAANTSSTGVHSPGPNSARLNSMVYNSPGINSPGRNSLGINSLGLNSPGINNLGLNSPGFGDSRFRFGHVNDNHELLQKDYLLVPNVGRKFGGICLRRGSISMQDFSVVAEGMSFVSGGEHSDDGGQLDHGGSTETI